jgi:hypothetical protein
VYPPFFFSILLSVLAAVFAVCAKRLKVLWSLHFVAFGFFLKEINEILGPVSKDIYIVDQACH